MASSRLEKIGNIFTRVQGLLKSGAMKEADKPLFFEIYKAFPPLKEPKYCDTVDPNLKIRSIFYSEDNERATRDDSNALFNINETMPVKRSVSDEFIQRPSRREIAPKDQTKIFDMKSIDFKEQ